MIRLANEQDIPRLIEMGSRSLQEGPYAGKIADNPEQATVLALQVIKEHCGKVLVAEEANALIGMLGLVILPNYYTGEKTAHEVIWWMEPEYRKSFTGLALFRRAEAEARMDGCVEMVFTAPNDAVAKAYQMMGYVALETSFFKRLDG